MKKFESLPVDWSSLTLRSMCAELGGVCIPMDGGQMQTGGERGGLVMVEIAHVKRPPEDQRVFEFKVSSEKPEHPFIVTRDCVVVPN